MKFEDIYPEDEKPLDHLRPDGGCCRIFQTIGVIGDSLSSGEYQYINTNGGEVFLDRFENSWGKYMERAMGNTVRVFARGGMKAKWFVEDFGEKAGYTAFENLCQAYIIALGVNDISQMISQGDLEMGSVADLDPHPDKNKHTFAGYYGKIVSYLKRKQPDAKFFFVTIPSGGVDSEWGRMETAHQKLLYDLADYFENAYVLDIRKYGALYDDKFKEKFFMKGHMNPMGYLLTADIIMSYIDYIIRYNPKDFERAGLIGTPYYRA